jgi:pimeloyl-ACP methyl ester carboxylesterase
MKVNVMGAAIYYIDQGQGTPTLLLHGNPDSSEVWSGVIPALAGHVRCIAPDLPGFGMSTAPEDFDYSLDGMAAFVDRFITELGITEPLNLVVHDIGGPFGLAWVVKHPEKVRSVVVMNTVFHADYRWHLFGRLWRTPVIGEIVQALTSRGGFTRELKRASRKLSRVQINRTYDLITPSVKKMMLRWYRAANPRNFAGWEEKMQTILASKHSIVLWAEHDPYIPGHYASRFGTRRVERFTDSGHWLPAELPDIVAASMLRFYTDSHGWYGINEIEKSTNVSPRQLKANFSF